MHFLPGMEAVEQLQWKIHLLELRGENLTCTSWRVNSYDLSRLHISMVEEDESGKNKEPRHQQDLKMKQTPAMAVTLTAKMWGKSYNALPVWKRNLITNIIIILKYTGKYEQHIGTSGHESPVLNLLWYNMKWREILLFCSHQCLHTAPLLLASGNMFDPVLPVPTILSGWEVRAQ